MQWTPDNGHDNWIPFFFNFEILFLLPTCLYAVYQHGVKADRKTGFTGPEELLYLMYAFVTGFTTLVCLNDVAYWDPAVYSAQDKKMFVFGLYGPYFAIRKFLSAGDMVVLYLLTDSGSQRPSCLRTCTPGCCGDSVSARVENW